MKIFVECNHCGGEGEIELTGTYAETYALLRKQKVEQNGAALAHMAGCKPTAMANRLQALYRHGLANYRTVGRSKFWRAI